MFGFLVKKAFFDMWDNLFRIIIMQFIDAHAFDVRSVKTGMLATTATVRLVADRAAAGDLPSLVVDPVMVASTGRRLLDDDAVATYRDRLAPQALLLTPNLFEAAILAGVEPVDDGDVATMVDLATRIHALGPTWVLVKGGHLRGLKEAVDIFYDGRQELLLSAPFVRGVSTQNAEFVRRGADFVGRMQTGAVEPGRLRADDCEVTSCSNSSPAASPVQSMELAGGRGSIPAAVPISRFRNSVPVVGVPVVMVATAPWRFGARNSFPRAAPRVATAAMAAA